MTKDRSERHEPAPKAEAGFSPAPLFSDWRTNAGRPKIQFSLLLFRLASAARWRFGPRHPASVAIGVLYRLTVEWILGIEIPWQTRVGPRLTIYHGIGIVINPYARIGADVSLRHGVTIGNRVTDEDAPTVGDKVNVGANASILGEITVGDEAVIGAHALVLRSVKRGVTVVGNPAREVVPPAELPRQSS